MVDRWWYCIPGSCFCHVWGVDGGGGGVTSLGDAQLMSVTDVGGVGSSTSWLAGW